MKKKLMENEEKLEWGEKEKKDIEKLLKKELKEKKDREDNEKNYNKIKLGLLLDIDWLKK